MLMYHTGGVYAQAGRSRACTILQQQPLLLLVFLF